MLMYRSIISLDMLIVGVFVMILFLLLINKQGQPRIVQYYENLKYQSHSNDQRENWSSKQQDIICKCLLQTEKLVSQFIILYIYI